MKKIFCVWIKQNKFVLAALLLLFVFAINLGGITAAALNQIYPEYSISQEDFATEKAELKDFVLQEDGTIYSQTVDPWVFVPYAENRLKNVFCVDINIANASNAGETFEIFYAYSYLTERAVIENRVIHVDLPKIDPQDVGIRFDLTSRQDQSITVEEILFNENRYITTFFCKRIWQILLWVAAVFVAYCINERKLKNEQHAAFKNSKMSGHIYLLCFAMGLPFTATFALERLFVVDCLEKTVILALLAVYIGNAVIAKNNSLYIGSLVYTIIHAYIVYELNDYPLDYFLKFELFNGILALNILLYMTVLLFFQKALGKNAGQLVFYILCAIYCLANLIKIYFQNSPISRADFYLINEIVGIAGQYVDFRYISVLLCVLAGGLFLAVKHKEYLKHKFAFAGSRQGILYFAVAVLLAASVCCNCFSAIGTDVKKEYYTNKDKLNATGFGVYSLIEFTIGWHQNEPEGYNEQIIQAVNNCRFTDSFSETGSVEDVSPNVILILAESLFEIENMPGVSFSKPLTGNLGPYKVANLVSPVYGGRTASTEFEAMTGLSNIFLPGDTIAYTTYLNEPGKRIGSLAREFADNQYSTYAIHANTASYYGRDTVYENMGFESFISIEDMALEKEDFLKDGYAKDSPFFEEIITTIKNSEEPVFIFGASIEAHSPYYEKYEECEISAFSEQYDTAVLEEAACYAQTVYNFDVQFGDLISYLEGQEEPVLVYVFGDHLPPIQINESAGYLNDVWAKYTTPLYAYSNYCDVSIEQEYISMNQIAPEILKRTGISYRAYFDYIRTLQENWPVLQKEITGENVSDETLKLYQTIQYDLLFGEKYLLE
ncbi:MAG: LTA synthase family protein [Peptococcaceae bacterium]|nr:LTA synthase family protein [Peptococcaceae bacterium]